MSEEDMEEVNMFQNFTYCPLNVSLGSINNGDISSCFIDTIINPLLILVAAAAGQKYLVVKLFVKQTLFSGLHQWRLYKRFSTPIETRNIRHSNLFIFQILFQLLLPTVSVAKFLLSGKEKMFLNEI